MVALRAEHEMDWGAVVRGRYSRCRSYDSMGTCFSFLPNSQSRFGWKYALDVEDRSFDSGDHIVSALGVEGLQSWLEIEVVAKLTDTPAHIVLRQFTRGHWQSNLRRNRIILQHCNTESHSMLVARRRISF